MWREAAAAGVFGGTFLLLALGRWGRVDVPRGAAALVGGAATAVILGHGWDQVDLDVLALLAGLMALAGLAAEAGLFAPLAGLARLPAVVCLGAALTTVAAASAALLNDAAVVVLVPILLPILQRRGLPGVACVVLMAVAANIGSLATPFGNPQNAALAAASGHGVREFMAAQWPLLAAGVAALWAAAWIVARRSAGVAAPDVPAGDTMPPARGLAQAAIPACGIGVFVGAALAGAALGVAAVVAAALTYAGLRVAAGPRVDRGLRAVDINILALFVGLYLLTAGLAAWAPDVRVGGTWAAPVVVASSNVFGNVPTVLSLLALDPAWSVAHTQFLVAVSTLGGALLLTGSAASLIAADVARRMGVRVGFGAFARHAVPWVAPLLVLAVLLHG